MNRAQSFLLVCIGISGLAVLLIVLPFVEYVLSAVVLAYVLYPIHQRLVPHLGEQVSPLLLIVATILAAFLPFYFIATALTRDLQNLARGRTGLEIESVETTLFEQFGLVIDIEQQLMIAARQLLDLFSSGATGLVAFALRTSLGVALLFFLLYYSLKDGPKFVAWARTNSPLPRDVTDHLFDRIEQTTWGVVIGHIFVAFLQGLLGGVGLWIAGIPSIAFWTFVMIVLALLPLIGALLVWAPAALYLAIIGDPVSATFLALYGILVVSTVDNFARPLVIDKRAHLNPGLILVGVFGGVYVLGFVGLFVGPIVLGIFVAMVVTFVEEYDTLAVGEPAIETASASKSVATRTSGAESPESSSEHGDTSGDVDDAGVE